MTFFSKAVLTTILAVLATLAAGVLYVTSDINTFTADGILSKEIVDMSAPVDVTINLEDFRREVPAYELK